MLQLADLVMVGQVGRAQPAALLLQLIQFVLHVVPLLLCHTHQLSLHFTNNHVNAEAHPASVACGLCHTHLLSLHFISYHAADAAAAHPAGVARVAYPRTLHTAVINKPDFLCSQCCVLGAMKFPA